MLAINNSTTAGLADVIATAVSNAVTVKARKGGPDGNLITIVGTAVKAAVSGDASGRLASGAVPTTVVISTNSSPNTISGAKTMAGGAGGAGTLVNVTL